MGTHQSRRIATYRAGRMGRSIGICFALAGWQITLIDSKSRIDWLAYKEGIEPEIAQILALLIDLDLLPIGSEAFMSERIALFFIDEGLSSLSNADLVL